jgi:putative spermidine/putrescine transport system permease protein
MKRMEATRVLLLVSNVVIYAFLFLPIIIVVATSFGRDQFIAFPPQGFTLRWYGGLFANSKWIDSFIYSGYLAVATCFTTLALGVPASYCLFRYRFAGQQFFRQLFLAPLIVPWIVTGVGILVFFTKLRLTGTFFGLLLGHTVVCTPYVVRSVLASLEGFDVKLEDAARSLGASKMQSFFRVTLPLIKPGIIAGAIFSFLMSFDNVPISIFLVHPSHLTLPVEMLNFISWIQDPTISAVATVYILMSLVILFIAEKTAGLGRLTGAA